MTKATLLAILFFSPIALAQQNLQEAQELLLMGLATTKEIIKNESLAWDKSFYQSLIEDDDANIKLLGYTKILSRSYGLDEKNSLQNIAIELNSMLASEVLSPKSIATIDNLCFSTKLEPFCDHEALFARQNKSMPDNASIYLQRFSLAYKDNNQDEIDQLIKNIAQSTYIDIHMYLHEGFRIKLEEYVKDNPFSKNELAMENLLILGFLHPNSKESEEISDNMENILIFVKVVVAKLREPIPSFKNIWEECNNNEKHEQACLKISELFINKSKSLITALIGHKIKIEIFKQRGNSKELEQAEASRDEYKNYYECVANIMNYRSPYISRKGVEFSKIAEPIEREFGEVALFESLAKLNYDYYSLTDKNINNPENCKKKPQTEDRDRGQTRTSSSSTNTFNPLQK
ncbi:MAG: hypothetical protein L3J24_06585 [Xanthomonadales bacterium]|nr:hypothetical protein [Xanthomonadales bacterium]